MHMRLAERFAVDLVQEYPHHEVLVLGERVVTALLFTGEIPRRVEPVRIARCDIPIRMVPFSSYKTYAVIN